VRQRLRIALVAAVLLLPGSAWADGAHYITPADVDLIDILPPPPVPGSPQDIADMKAVMDAQKARTAADVEAAEKDFKKSIFRFRSVIGPDFSAEKMPFTDAFFRRVLEDDAVIVQDAKQYFMRPRPFITNAAVDPVMLRPGGGGYPSGHSTFAYVAAVLVGKMVPEKREAIFARADQFAMMRVVSGEHYPSDVEAGRISASIIANALLHSPKFMADFNQSEAEVRKVLKLKDLPPTNGG
jgi:acid phosphatase (class A)